MEESRIGLPYYSLKQAAKIIGCTKSNLMIFAANRMTRIHVLTGGRAHWFSLFFDENDRLVKVMKALPEICLVPFEFWARRVAGEDCQLNSLTSVDSKNMPDGIGDVLYLAPWYDCAGKTIEFTKFVILKDELDRLKQVLQDRLMQAEAVRWGEGGKAGTEPKSTKNGGYKDRDEDFKKWLEGKELKLDGMTKEQIHNELIKRNGAMWRAGFPDWWKQQTFYRGKPGRKKQLIK